MSIGFLLLERCAGECSTLRRRTEAYPLAKKLRRWDYDGVRGDRVEIVVDIGDGTKTYEIVATKAGRRVEVSNVRGTVEVSEVTRTGVIVRSGRFMATRVVAVIEYPALDEQTEGGPRKPGNQSSLL
ncbi:MAG: hypothetical protein QOG21_1174 [Actinomycetota bacterium]|jgi:hypothetical protein|nr:hypothetical protein [Actinomycetota bacterium]